MKQYKAMEISNEAAKRSLRMLGRENLTDKQNAMARRYANLATRHALHWFLRSQGDFSAMDWYSGQLDLVRIALYGREA